MCFGVLIAGIGSFFGAAASAGGAATAGGALAGATIASAGVGGAAAAGAVGVGVGAAAGITTSQAVLFGVSVAGSAISTGISIAGAQAQAGFDQKVAQRNAKIHKIQAGQALQRGEMDAATVGREFAQLVGRQKAAFAGQGFDVSAGDPNRLIESTLSLGRQEQALVQYNAQLDAWAATESAVGAIQAGKASQFRANIASTSSAISGVTGIAQAGVNFGRAGGFSRRRTQVGQIN